MANGVLPTSTTERDNVIAKKLIAKKLLGIF